MFRISLKEEFLDCQKFGWYREDPELEVRVTAADEAPKINNSVFVRLTKATMSMLKIVEPYIAYGTPQSQVGS